MDALAAYDTEEEDQTTTVVNSPVATGGCGGRKREREDPALGLGRDEQRRLKRERRAARAKANAAAAAVAAVEAAVTAAASSGFPSLVCNASAESQQQATAAAAHDGRVRSFAHVDGNWAAHLFVPIDMLSPDTVHKEAACARGDFERQVRGAMRRADEDQTATQPSLATRPWQRIQATPTHTQPPQADSSASPSTSPGGCLHISLSRTFVLRQPQIEPFVRQLRAAVEQVIDSSATLLAKATSLSPPAAASLPLLFRAWKVYENDERTRRFLAALLYPTGEPTLLHAGLKAIPCSGQFTIGSGSAPAAAPRLLFACTASHTLLHHLLTRINRLLCEWGAPPYYEPPELHATVAWTLALDPSPQPPIEGGPLPLQPADSSVAAASDPPPSSLPPECVAVARHLQCMIGKRSYFFPLTRP